MKELDTHFDGNDMTPEEIEKAEREWTDNLIDAATRAKQRGELPVGMKRLIDELLQPRLPWKSLLLKYLRPHLMPVDWSYHKPHKKSYQLDVFLPVTLKEGVEVEVIVDTSGSINNPTFYVDVGVCFVSRRRKR